MCILPTKTFANLYAGFPSAINSIDCGEYCSIYNDDGIPFCCDIRHTIPTAYQVEWEYLQSNTGLWRMWQSDDPEIFVELLEQAPEGHTLIACKGHQLCQRGFRSISCRSFPFYPYISSRGELIGLSYYWEYEDRCWVISNLQVVTKGFLEEFIQTYEQLFELFGNEKKNFSDFSAEMREIFSRSHRAIPLLHRNGSAYKISPRDERLRRYPVERFPRLGPYKIAAELTFPDEI